MLWLGGQTRLFQKRTLNPASNTGIRKVVFCLTCLNTPYWLTEELKILVVFCKHDLQPQGTGIYKRWPGGFWLVYTSMFQQIIFPVLWFWEVGLNSLNIPERHLRVLFSWRIVSPIPVKYLFAWMYHTLEFSQHSLQKTKKGFLPLKRYRTPCWTIQRTSCLYVVISTCFVISANLRYVFCQQNIHFKRWESGVYNCTLNPEWIQIY